MQSLWQDMRYALRMLFKIPGFTIIVVATLALGIGANTAIFSIVNAILINPIPFKDAEQLVMAFTRTSRDARNWVAYPDLQDWQTQNSSFSGLSAIVPQSVNLTGRDEPTRVIGGFVSANFFDLLGVGAAIGRTFYQGEDNQGAERVAIVSYEIWQNRLGADPQLIGQTLNLNGQPFTVVGILPEGFHFAYSDCEVWLPIQYYPNFTLNRSTASSGVIGRLKPGVTLRQAQADLETVANHLTEQYPDTNQDRSISLVPLREILVEQLRPSLLLLLSAVGFLLLIACANVANLTLARSVARQKELALRMALGAGRQRVIRLLLTESVLLGLIGGTLGLLIGSWGVELLMKGSPTDLPPGIQVKLDMNVLGFTFLIAVLTGIAFGIAPAIRFSKPDINDILKEGGKGSGAAVGSNWIRSTLVISQVALALLLLIGSGLLVQSFRALLQVNPGFNPKNLLTMEYRVPRNKYPEPAQQWAFHKRVVEQVGTLPGVTSASVVLALPHSGNGFMVSFIPLDLPAPQKGEEPRALGNRADPYFFSTMGIPLLRGRVFSETDTMNTQPVVVVNQALADRYWPGQDPIGKSLRLPDSNNMIATIVGVVGNIKHSSLDEPTGSQLYTAFAQTPHIFATLVVRTEGEPMASANAVRQAIWGVDKDQPVWKVRTMEFLLERSVSGSRFLMRLLAIFSGLALLLAAVGIYGVISYSVSQRTNEIGIRMALGARTTDVIRLILKQGLVLTLSGVGTGLLAAFALTRLMQGLLYGVSATDTLTFAFVTVILTGVAMVACFVPARRAAKTDPIIALRYE